MPLRTSFYRRPPFLVTGGAIPPGSAPATPVIPAAIFAAVGDGSVRRINTDGSVAWTAASVYDPATEDFWGLTTDVDDGAVYLRIRDSTTSDGTMKRLSGLDGSVIWSVAANFANSGATGVAAQRGGNLVVYTDSSENLVALDKSDGSEVWSVATGANYRTGPVAFSLDGTVIYEADTSHTVPGTVITLRAFNAADGSAVGGNFPVDLSAYATDTSTLVVDSAGDIYLDAASPGLADIHTFQYHSDGTAGWMGTISGAGTTATYTYLALDADENLWQLTKVYPTGHIKITEWDTSTGTEIDSWWTARSTYPTFGLGVIAESPAALSGPTVMTTPGVYKYVYFYESDYSTVYAIQKFDPTSGSTISDAYWPYTDPSNVAGAGYGIEPTA